MPEQPSERVGLMPRIGERAERAEAEVARLRERLSRLEAAARAVLPLLGMGPAQGFSAEPYRAKARLALVLDESDSPFSCEEGTETSAGEQR